ncbi:MAG: hypothetical protein R3B99_00245 [Polyangiales bacterium]
MSDAPTHCAVCSTAIPPGAPRCIACGAVWGEDNRCPHCYALAAIQATGDGRYACMACGKPRAAKPNTTIVGGLSPLAAPVVEEPAARRAGDGPVVAPVSVASPTLARRGASTGLRLAGIFGIAGGVLAATAAAMIVPGVGGLAIAAILGSLGVGLGAWGIRAGSAGDERHAQRVDTQVELAILQLAEQKKGVLTVTDVARGLGLSAADADAALSAMADGSRVSAELTPDGLVRYVFRELRTLQGEAADEGGVVVPRVRVEAEERAPADDAMAEAHAEVEAILAETRTREEDA